MSDQQVVLVRHAETEWSQAGRHTGTTDLPLLDEGRRKARLAGERVRGQPFACVLTSPLERAVETCRLAGYDHSAVVRHELAEWDYGEFEGLTTAEIRERNPGWVLWHDGAPGGESPDEIEQRIDGLVTELDGICADGGDVLAFAHGHLLQGLAVRWVGLPIADGRLFRLATGSLSRLGWKRGDRVIDMWNDTGHPRS